jgi:hypothetical protein
MFCPDELAVQPFCFRPSRCQYPLGPFGEAIKVVSHGLVLSTGNGSFSLGEIIS